MLRLTKIQSLLIKFNVIVDHCINGLNIISEQFERHSIIVTLEWIQGNPLYSCYVSVTPPIQLHFDGATNVIMNLFYNIPYNLTIRNNICPGFVFTQRFYYGSITVSVTINYDVYCGQREF
jgi:hypothetical protein